VSYTALPTGFIFRVGSSHKKRKEVNGVEKVLWGSYILPRIPGKDGREIALFPDFEKSSIQLFEKKFFCAKKSEIVKYEL
jgi:hypothetical protein